MLFPLVINKQVFSLYEIYYLHCNLYTRKSASVYSKVSMKYSLRPDKKIEEKKNNTKNTWR